MIRIRFSVILATICLILGLTIFRQAGLHSTPSANEAKSNAKQTPLPDLIVDQASLRQHWVVRVEDLPASFCSVQEGEITPGEHTLVRFTVGTPNVGDADLDQHVDDGLFEFASCHDHYHFRHYALYELVNPRNGFVWRAAKRGFCMIDVEKYQAYTGDADNKPHFRSCGAIGVPGNQGISKGWSDVYDWKLGGQFFVLDGGVAVLAQRPRNDPVVITWSIRQVRQQRIRFTTQDSGHHVDGRRSAKRCLSSDHLVKHAAE